MGEWCDERVGKYIEGKYCEKWKHELSNWSNYKWWVNSEINRRIKWGGKLISKLLIEPFFWMTTFIFDI